MGIFLQFALASMLLSVALVYFYDHTVGQVVNRATSTVRVGVFVGAWTAITTILGLRGFGKAVRALRGKTKTKGVDGAISPVPKQRA